MAEQTELKTNHNVRVVNLATGQNVLCIFGEIRSEDEEKRVVGYRLVYPFTLSLDTPNEDGTIPIQYARFCPYSQWKNIVWVKNYMSVCILRMVSSIIMSPN